MIRSRAARAASASVGGRMAEGLCLLGLTGGIAMGKSTVAAYLRETLGVPLHCSDEAVAELYSPGGAAVPVVAQLVPAAVADGAVDKKVLSQAIMEDPGLLPQLEALVHPLVAQVRVNFMDAAQREHWLAVLDVPLLFESDPHWRAHAMNARNGVESLAPVPGTRPLDVSAVIAMYAPEDVQRERALSRGNMTAEKFDLIAQKQTTNAFRAQHSDFVADTSHPWSFAPSRGAVAQAIETLRYSPAWRRSYRSWANGGARGVKAITFDIDKTLCPLFPPLLLAKEAIEDAMTRHMPAAKRVMEEWREGDEKPLDRWIRQARERFPDVSYDLTDLRIASLEIAAAETGDDPAAAHMCMRAFLKVRAFSANEHAYDEVLPCFELLQSKYPEMVVAALTNGNCHATGEGLAFSEETGIAATEQPVGDVAVPAPFGLMDFCITARDAGDFKPGVTPYLAAAAAAQRARSQRGTDSGDEVRPGDIVHVGDDLFTDVAGSLAAGCRAVYVKREPGWPELSELPEHLARVIRRGLGLADGADVAHLIEDFFPEYETRCLQVASLAELDAAIEPWINAA